MKRKILLHILCLTKKCEVSQWNNMRMNTSFPYITTKTIFEHIIIWLATNFFFFYVSFIAFLVRLHCAYVSTHISQAIVRTFGKNIKFVWTREKISTNKKIFQRHDFEIISESYDGNGMGKTLKKVEWKNASVILLCSRKVIITKLKEMILGLHLVTTILIINFKAKVNKR